MLKDNEKNPNIQETEIPSEELSENCEQQEYNRSPVQLTGEELPYLYDLEFVSNVKYPKFSYYAAETFYLLFKNRYQIRPELTGNFSFGYGGIKWDPFTVLFVPGVIGQDGEIIEESFHPDNHESLTNFFDDLQSVNEDTSIKIVEDKRNFFKIHATNPISVLELLKNYIAHFGVPTKSHSMLSKETLLKEGVPEHKVLDVIQHQLDQTAMDGEMVYNSEYSDTAMGNFALRFCANRPYTSLKSVFSTIAVSSQLDLQASLEELSAALHEEMGNSTNPVRGFDLVN